MSKFDKMIQKKVTDKAETKMPKANAPKDFTSYNVKRASKEDMRVLDVAWAVKSIKEKNGLSFGQNDVDDILAYAETKGVTKALLTTNIEDLIPSGPSGQLIMDAWNDVKLSTLIPMEEVVDVSITRALQDNRLNVFRVGEGVDATESNQSFTHFRYIVDKIMSYAVISTESLEDSMIDLAEGVIRDMQQGFAEAFENAIINGHNVVAEFNGTDWDLTDIDGNAVTASNPITQFKGVRRLGFEKAKIDFGGTDLTDAQFLDKVFEMQTAGGKYFTNSKISQGKVGMFVDLSTYQRMSRFTDVFERQIIGTGETIEKFNGIPLYQLDFMPQVSATGIIGATANTFGTLVMANVEFLKAYMKAGSTSVKTDENIKNDTQAWAMRSRVGFGGEYDSTETNFPVDTARKYVVLGYNIK